MREALVDDVAAMTAEHIVEAFAAKLSREKREAVYAVVKEYVRAGLEAYDVLATRALTEPCEN